MQAVAVYSLFSSTCDDTSFADVLQTGKATVREVLNSLSGKVLRTHTHLLQPLPCPLSLQVLSSRRIDHAFALGLLLLLPPVRAMDRLQGIRSKNVSSYSKVIVSSITIHHVLCAYVCMLPLHTGSLQTCH